MPVANLHVLAGHPRENLKQWIRETSNALAEILAAPPTAPRGAANPAALPDEAAHTLEIAVGILIHRCLELIAQQGLAAWTVDRLPSLLPGWQRWLQARGFSEDEAASGAGEALAALTTTLSSETGRWLLSAHTDAAAEQAWTSRDGDSLAQHVIDRVFVADGTRWIVDYKTVRAPQEELAARAEGFRPQLERYARLFANDPLPLRLAVWFVLQGQLVTL